MTELCYTIEFLSDWHIGSGSGISGSVDRLMIRDTNDLPFVPAKTMTGIWRDAAERLATALDSPNDCGWTDFVLELFGDQPSIQTSTGKPRAARVHIRPAHYPQSIVETVAGLSAVETVGVVTTIRSTTAIDPRTGTARAHTLRSAEMGRAGSTLSGVIELDYSLANDSAVRDTVISFLGLAAGLIDVVGGKRRRGAGQCTVILESDGHPVTVDIAQVPWVAPSLPNYTWSATPKMGKESEDFDDRSTDFHTLDVDIDILLPVIIPTGTLGNVVETADHLTGRNVLATICGLLRNAGIDGDGMVSAGCLFVSPAQPLNSGLRCLPTPLALSKAKHSFKSDDSTQNPDVVNTLFPRLGDTQYKQMRGGWIVTLPANEESKVTFRSVNVSRVERTHATISDAAQRPTSDVGGVFTYQAIAPGQSFRTQISVLAKADERQRIKDVIAGAETAMGTSRKDDYGRVRLSTTAGWIPIQRTATSHRKGWDPGMTITLLCTSDVVLLDESLRPTTSIDALKKALTEALEVEINAIEVAPDGVRIRGNRHDAWNSTWGLPHSTLLTIGAGSTICFDVRSTIPGEKIAEIETLGIGERRAAGFGRVVLDHPIVIHKEIEFFDQDATIHSQLSVGLHSADPTNSPLIVAMQIAWWTRWISSNFDRLINSDLDSKIKDLIELFKSGSESSGQLNKLRSILVVDRRIGNESSAMRWLSSPITSKRWRPSTVEQLKALIQTPESVWDGLFGLKQKNPSHDGTAEPAFGLPPQHLAADSVILFLEKASRQLTRHEAPTGKGE